MPNSAALVDAMPLIATANVHKTLKISIRRPFAVKKSIKEKYRDRERAAFQLSNISQSTEQAV
jgi:hypothetical protein